MLVHRVIGTSTCCSAEWMDRPGPLLGSGATVFAARERWEQEIRPFVGLRQRRGE
jgi:hypothetical protein